MDIRGLRLGPVQAHHLPPFGWKVEGVRPSKGRLEGSNFFHANGEKDRSRFI